MACILRLRKHKPHDGNRTVRTGVDNAAHTAYNEEWTTVPSESGAMHCDP